MRPTVEDVHHRDGKNVGVRASEVTEERQVRRLGSRVGHSQGDAKNGVGTDGALVRCAVEREHLGVDESLFAGLETEKRRADLVKDSVDSLLNALAAVPLFVAVAALSRLEGARGGARRDRRPRNGAIIESDLDLDGWIAARIEDLASDYCLNAGHKALLRYAG